MDPKREPKRPDRPAAALGLLALAIGAMGAGGALAQTVTITPTVQTRLTWTDNVGATSDKESDWIAELSPGISVSRESGRVNGLLNAQLRNVGHANDTGRNASFLALQGRGEVEALEELLFVELDANISRSNQSSFFGRSANDELNVDENNETRSWSIGPRLQFRLGASTQGSIRYLSRWLDSGGATVSNQRLDQWNAQISSPVATRVFGWGIDYSRSRSEYDDSVNRNVTQQTARATLFINITPQFRLRAIAGHESNDFATSRSESGSIYGGGFDWDPTERTSVSGTVEDRMFGTGYNLSFKHRAARSTWDLSYVRDFSSSLQSFSNNEQLAQAEAICQAIFGFNGVPQPGLALQVYDACLASLGFNRLNPQDIVSNAQFLSESFRAGFSLVGVRNTLSFMVQQSDRSRLSSLTGLSATDDFALSDTVKTTSATVSFSHKLSGLSALNSAITRSRSEGGSGTGLDTRRLSATLGLTTQLGPRTNAGLSYRYQRSDGSSAGSDFTENAITANLGITF